MKGKEYEFEGVKVDTEYADQGITLEEAVAEAVGSAGNRLFERDR